MQGIMRLKEAIKQHHENKDINLKYKTPLTKRNIDTKNDEQDIDDACNPIRCDRKVLISDWLRRCQGE